MANFNKVLLLGNLTRDVELRQTQGGSAMAKFGMATNRKWTQNGEAKESTCFVDLTAWGKQAEVLAQYAKKGSQLMVEGRLEYSQWEAKDGGGKRSKLEVVVETFQFIGARAAEGEERPAPRAAAPKPSAGEDFDDIPFGWLIALPLALTFF